MAAAPLGFSYISDYFVIIQSHSVSLSHSFTFSLTYSHTCFLSVSYLVDEVLTFELSEMDLFPLIDTSFLPLFPSWPSPVTCEAGGHIRRSRVNARASVCGFRHMSDFIPPVCHPAVGKAQRQFRALLYSCM